MDSMNIPVELRCGKCGQKTLEASGEGETPADNAEVTCTSCGNRIGTWAEVREHALQQSTEQIKKQLADTFGDAFKPR
jgi:DNA-directed RNA polymerase subunit RPC12/RpoP